MTGLQSGSNATEQETTMAYEIEVNSVQTAPPDPNDVTFNQLLGINNEGTIAGYFGSGAQNHPNKGYTFTPPYNQTDFHNENFAGSVQTQVTGINNEGVTVGFWSNTNNADMGTNNNFGFVDNNGVMSLVDDPKGLNADNGMTVEQLLGVNDKDVAVGFWTDKHGDEHGFTYNIQNHSFTEVDIPGFASTQTSAINNKGDIAGFVSNGGQTPDVSFIKEGNTIDWLTGPKGAVSVQALGINNEDQVVGSFTDTTGAMHGFIYDSETNTYATVNATNNAQTGPTAMTVLNGINDKGQVVGFYLDKNGNTDGLGVTFSVKHS
jgi:hypothetical protein